MQIITQPYYHKQNTCNRFSIYSQWKENKSKIATPTLSNKNARRGCECDSGMWSVWSWLQKAPLPSHFITVSVKTRCRPSLLLPTSWTCFCIERVAFKLNTALQNSANFKVCLPRKISLLWLLCAMNIKSWNSDRHLTKQLKSLFFKNKLNKLLLISLIKILYFIIITDQCVWTYKAEWKIRRNGIK